MFGLLNIHKQQGLTSRDVVNHIQRIVRPAKTGHAGTLDPLATGVLVVGVGPATRLIEYIQQLPKRYVGSFELGKTSDTEDVEGQVRKIESAPRPSRDEVEGTLAKFVGEIQQRPPAFSALKVKGRRAYELAREGKSVELNPRAVTIYALELVEYEYPKLILNVRCGSGTYIRSLGRDIGQSLGSGAVMTSLKRTAIGGFLIEDACSIDCLTKETITNHLQPALRAVSHFPRCQLTNDESTRIANGMMIENRWECGAEQIAATNTDGQLIAILAPRDKRQLRPIRNLRVH